ncbi:peptide MFS transporter [Sinosporangium siamense]|uniref:Peptide transporter n=1 Tax=Sinosporangium siamense TaxID=1367973 RepID=A0A919RMV8_9ACTN|nr:oligopeptide:H+ symporter [Sinosporangium siamense]GII95081.1 peptide transporter [Sinosporangium siamense]
MSTRTVAEPDSPGEKTFFGYPRWFATLFLTDMWERFSFYGMQALLALYAASPRSEGGLGLDTGTAGALFGIYMAVAFVLPLPGGWLGDRVLGAQRATLWGAVVIALGHYCLMVPFDAVSYLGLLLVAAGTGLLKPNMAAVLGRFYGPGEDARRESAFSIFYMSVQVSALIAPLVTGFLGERVHWHAGFGAAAFGMTAGVLQYVLGRRRFGELGRLPEAPAPPHLVRSLRRRAVVVAAVAGSLLTVDVMAGWFTIEHVLAVVGLTVIVVPILYFRSVLRQKGLTAADLTRLRAYRWLFAASALFWMCFAQSGAVFSFFAERYTDRDLLGMIIPASWFQSLSPLFILALAPGAAWLWLRAGDRLDVPRKYALGLAAMGASLTVMAVASANSPPVSPLWLVLAFFLLACGEVVLGPVGLSASAQIAPERAAGRMMGLFWLSAALGAALGAQFARLWPIVPGPAFFGFLLVPAFLAAVCLVVGGDRLRRSLTS